FHRFLQDAPAPQVEDPVALRGKLQAAFAAHSFTCRILARPDIVITSDIVSSPCNVCMVYRNRPRSANGSLGAISCAGPHFVDEVESAFEATDFHSTLGEHEEYIGISDQLNILRVKLTSCPARTFGVGDQFHVFLGGVHASPPCATDPSVGMQTPVEVRHT